MAIIVYREALANFGYPLGSINQATLANARATARVLHVVDDIGAGKDFSALPWR